MLLGLYTNILENDHLTLPAAFREAYTSGLYVTQGFDRNILVLTLQAFQVIYEKITALNLADPVARLLLRMILASAHELSATTDGRIHVPEGLRNFAELEQKIILVGQGDFIEIWSPENWNKQTEKILSADEGHFSSLNITTR